MVALTERFASGRISARDATRILGAGLRAAGHALSDEEVAKLKPDHGAAGAVAIVAELLAVTFGGPIAGAAARSVTESLLPAAEGKPDPFLGPR
jgi:hypothetical protein